MGLLGNIWKNRHRAGIASRILGILESVVDTAQNLSEARKAMAEKAKRGDLDEAINLVLSAKRTAESYIKNG